MKALIVVDPQNDFFEGGNLQVSNSLQIIPNINKLIDSDFDVVVITKDWHPYCHVSFASTHNKELYSEIEINGGIQRLWPDHCIQKMHGSEIHPDININVKNIFFFVKGIKQDVDSYSAFFDNNGSDLGLTEFLQDKEITETYICGLALDYCCLFTALDSQKVGFKTPVILDATMPVNVDTSETISKLINNGIDIMNTDNIIKS